VLLTAPRALVLVVQTSRRMPVLLNLEHEYGALRGDHTASGEPSASRVGMGRERAKQFDVQREAAP